MSKICGTTSARFPPKSPRLLAGGVLIYAVGLALLAPGLGVAGTTTALSRPKPQKLWRSYPLDTSTQRKTGTTSSPRRSSQAREPSSSSSNDMKWVLVGIGGSALLAVAVAAFGPLRRRRIPAVHGRVATAFAANTVTNGPAKGDQIMDLERIKLWTRGDGAAQSPESQEQEAGGGTDATDAAAVRVSPAAESIETKEEPLEVAPPTAADAVGAEVGTVLKSAQEAATRIHRQAEEDASNTRKEAEAAAAAQLDDARRVAEAERADGVRVRAEAEEQAQSTRAAADAYAQQVRADAEREAREIREQAQQRLEQADTEVAERLRQAEGEARHRRDALVSETEQYHQRLEKMLGVFHGMSSQLEELLGIPRGDTRERDNTGEETLEGALQPGDPTSFRAS